MLGRPGASLAMSPVIQPLSEKAPGQAWLVRDLPGIEPLLAHPLDIFRLSWITEKLPHPQLLVPGFSNAQEVVKIEGILVKLPEDKVMIPPRRVLASQHDGRIIEAPLDADIYFRLGLVQFIPLAD